MTTVVDAPAPTSFDIASLFSTARTHSLRPASVAEYAALNALTSLRNGKRFLRCQVRRKEIKATPEEAVRQLWIWRLVHTYGYPLSRLAVERPINFGRDTSNRADIVVFDADRPETEYIIVEVKKTTAKSGDVTP